MKKIIISIILLLIAIVTMAYLYFSKLNANHSTSDIGLFAATSSSGFIFSFENEKGITDILKEQQLFNEILGDERYKELTSLKKYVLALPKVSQSIENQNVYFSFVPGNNLEMDILCITQLNNPSHTPQLLHAIKASGTQLEPLNNLNKVTLADSTIFYLGIKGNLVVLSNSPQQVTTVLAKNLKDKDDKFAEYIQASNRFNKNSLAQLYINFNTLPTLLKNIIPGKLNGELSSLQNQNSFAVLTYNYSKDKILLTGTTIANNPNNYYNLFSDLNAQKINIQNILPINTSSYTIFAVDHYLPWRKKLNHWFLSRHEDKRVTKLITDINTRYHLNLDDIFPKYFQDQLITFQLSTAEKIGAINLTNGDKLMQLLIDLSEDYNDEIKLLKEDDMLYAYFGLPFEGFKKPFYIILDNYMIFANNASTLTSFLNNYNNNHLLINTTNYIGANNQLPGNSSISVYIDHANSTSIFSKNIYPSYDKDLQSDKGLKKYDSFTYQLSGDNGKFQTNILINKTPDVLRKDSLAL
ncbi:MAG: hypothetical protein P0Y49_06410 [Candidatus Pedobacter colombiensis]|uniref:DUF3352 domain-containing protein n=1 Tax=Candidatus Pedobacter colombiensis TaxID=3121371 RepID=A0AAJ5WA00_9SPHI|nr:hypothetical protein [Pedobacter sp.]WEK20767.1 MAG: hypothetical protein P0Y49_06410 [Pedobacter sp.]